MSTGSETFELRTPDDTLLAAERERVIACVREALPSVDVHEVGSTAVAGVIGKGDLDLVVRVSAQGFEAVRGVLDRLFQRNPKQHASGDYQGYVVDSPLDVAIQLTLAGGPCDDFDRFLAALRSSPERIRAYNDLKRAWHGREMEGYRRAKSAFIEATLVAVAPREDPAPPIG